MSPFLKGVSVCFILTESTLGQGQFPEGHAVGVWRGLITSAQDSQSRRNIVGRDMASLQLLMQICQLVCSISARIGLPRSHIQNPTHLGNHPGLPRVQQQLSGMLAMTVMVENMPSLVANTAAPHVRPHNIQ